MITLFKINVCNGNESPLEVVETQQDFKTMVEFEQNRKTLKTLYNAKYEDKDIEIDLTWRAK